MIFICASFSLLIVLLPEYYYVRSYSKNYAVLLKSLFEVTQSIFLQSRWECRTQWSQHSRPVALKWLTFNESLFAFSQLLILLSSLYIFLTTRSGCLQHKIIGNSTPFIMVDN